MTEPPPDLSWQLLREIIESRTSRPDAWRDAGRWMLDVLERRFGKQWPGKVLAAGGRSGAGFLVRATQNTVAFGDLLELALRLELLEHVPGYGVVRKALRFDPRVDQILHCRMQLELAGMAVRAGMPCVLEPHFGDEPPADVAFESPSGRLVIEARAIQANDKWRLESAHSDEILETLHAIEARYGVSCRGKISKFLPESAVAELYSAIEDRARLVAAGLEAPLLSLHEGSLEVVPRLAPGDGRLTGPRLEGEAWRRIASRILEKTDGAVRSGANWLRIDAMNGLWMFTQWSVLPLPSKALELKRACTFPLPGMSGVVFSSGAVMTQGKIDDEVFAFEDVIAVRRALPFLRGREMIAIATDGEQLDQLQVLSELYRNESTWLDWALGQVGLPDVGSIMA